ncbi:MAG: hypothetical protein LBT82_03925 [Oscillospiraceae bacterium]|jgi:hypothetical protein|nr:hypothetical protein [Oscillospiraceae bacterium]
MKIILNYSKKIICLFSLPVFLFAFKTLNNTHTKFNLKVSAIGGIPKKTSEMMVKKINSPQQQTQKLTYPNFFRQQNNSFQYILQAQDLKLFNFNFLPSNSMVIILVK